MVHSCLPLLLWLTLTRAQAADVGFGIEPIDLRVDCSSPWSWRHNISFPVARHDAQFLVVRIARLQLPLGARLVIRDDRGSELDVGSLSSDTPFFTRPLFAQRVVVDYSVPPAAALLAGACFGFAIDELRFAAQSADRTSRTPEHPDNLKTYTDNGLYDDETDAASNCTSSDDTTAPVACVQFDAAVFSRARAVARLLIHKPSGSVFCTGWLIGCEGHIITNHHCVGSDADANATSIEFLAQGRDCADDCDAPMGCPGIIEATSATIVAASPIDDLDFTLLLPRLPLARRRRLTTTYGFLSLRPLAAVLNERIFIPQHPSGFGKRVALKHGTAYGGVTTLSNAECNAGSASVGYYLDTQGGSSGAPVIAYKDKAVVGLHYCGGCLNSAIPASRIVVALTAANALPHCACVNPRADL